jgi:septal ring factor EnvC (AmiA/AmiB activator)
MELLVAVVALVVAVVALGLVLSLRSQLGTAQAAAAELRGHLAEQRRLQDATVASSPPLRAAEDAWQAEIDAVRAELAQTAQELGALRREAEQTTRELGELRAAAEVVPVPPLPKSRRADLDELREQLRASHRESAAEDEPSEPPSP